MSGGWRKQKQPKCPSVHEWMKTVPQVEYYQVLKMKMRLDVCWYQNISMASVECKKQVSQLCAVVLFLSSDTCEWMISIKTCTKVCFLQIWLSLGVFFPLYPLPLFNRLIILRLPCVNSVFWKNNAIIILENIKIFTKTCVLGEFKIW